MMISRNSWIAFGALAVFAATGRANAAPPILTAIDVRIIVAQGVQAAMTAGQTHGYIAVSDREGYILGLYNLSGAAPAANDLGPFNAIDKAGTAAYLSSNGEAFTSRTAGFIIQPHFPPGISNTGTGPLTGVGLSSLPFSDINHFRTPPPNNPATPIPNTSLSGNPGGVPIYKGGVLVGGVGVDTGTALSALVFIAGSFTDEDIAVIAQSGYAPPDDILATQVLINGIRVPYTSFIGQATAPLPALNNANFINPLNFAATFPPVDSPGAPFNPLSANPFPDVPNSEVRNKIIDSPLLGVAGGQVGGQNRLSAAEVTTILHQAAARAAETRGAIRNPIGPAEVFIVVVDYYNPANPPGTTIPGGAGPVPPTVVPQVLGSLRTSDATIFSYDVAAQKARTALFFSNNVIALSSRAVGFLAQGAYPPGIDGTVSGPYGPPTYGPSNANFGIVAGVPLFNPPFGIQSAVSINPNAGIPVTPINQFLPNGITVFPGGFPLYRNGVLIGAVGVSGDGVDQDDIISASATVGFEAPTNIRSDEYTYRGARLPYAKFPQNSSL
jgi:uncharacterized protein GlcG (DUF336 family)